MKAENAGLRFLSVLFSLLAIDLMVAAAITAEFELGFDAFFGLLVCIPGGLALFAVLSLLGSAFGGD